jgi:hypothetical protein
MTGVALPCLAAQAGHNWESCGFPSYGGTYEPREIKSVDELPAPIRQLVARHISARVGLKFFDDITFYRGQVVDVTRLHREYPESKNFQWRVPTYNLLYQFRLPGREIFLACILLDDTGGVIQELSLPHWGLQVNPAALISLAKASDIAREKGVVLSDAPSELKYFPDTDTLEWVFEWKTWDNGLTFGGKRLHVPIQPPTEVHWSPWSGIR